MNLEQVPSYPLPVTVGPSCSVSVSRAVRCFPTALYKRKVVEKKEENVVLHTKRPALSTNLNLID